MFLKMKHLDQQAKSAKEPRRKNLLKRAKVVDINPTKSVSCDRDPAYIMVLHTGKKIHLLLQWASQAEIKPVHI